MKVSPLTDAFGVIVEGVDLDAVSPQTFGDLRALFEEHSALVFKRQGLSEDAHLRLAAQFGPIEDREADERKPDDPFTVPAVSNETETGGVTGAMDFRTLNLKANQQWHIDSTFLPVPALCNIITAKVLPSSGGETELASSRAAWAAMPERLRAQIRGKILGHNLRRSREVLSKELADLPMFNKWPPQRWPAVWTNPVNGRESLYLASHAFEIEGMDKTEGRAVLDELIAFCTQPQFTYSHSWEVDDVLIWDQRAVLHRGMPWPYDEPRTLKSTCTSMQGHDGLDAALAAVGRA